MTPGTIVYRIVTDRLAWIETMVSDIKSKKWVNGHPELVDTSL